MTMIFDGTAGITLPSGAVSNTTSTVVGISDTQTLTNKSLVASQLTGTQTIPKGTLPTGSVLQVLQTATAATIQTSSTSFVTTGFAQSITPTSATSKIMICINGGGAYMLTSAQTTMRVTIYRGSTDLSAGYGVTNNGMMRFSTVGGQWMLCPYSMMWLDSPATTSSTTYTVYFRNADAAATVDFSNTDRGVVTLTLMEIAA
jgi:hypothetical protein